jgi:hypothetical protein
VFETSTVLSMSTNPIKLMTPLKKVRFETDTVGLQSCYEQEGSSSKSTIECSKQLYIAFPQSVSEVSPNKKLTPIIKVV